MQSSFITATLWLILAAGCAASRPGQAVATEAVAAPSCKTVFEEEATAFKTSLNSGAVPEELRYDNLLSGLDPEKRGLVLDLALCGIPMMAISVGYDPSTGKSKWFKTNNTIEDHSLRILSDDNFDEEFAEAYQQPEIHDKAIHALRHLFGGKGPGMVSDEAFLACFETDDMKQAEECYKNLAMRDKAQAVGILASLSEQVGSKEVDWTAIPDDAAVKAIDLFRNHLWEGFQAFRGARCIMPIARHCTRIVAKSVEEMPDAIRIPRVVAWPKDEADFENPRVASPGGAKAQHGPVNVAISIHVSGSQQK